MNGHLKWAIGGAVIGVGLYYSGITSLSFSDLWPTSPNDNNGPQNSVDRSAYQNTLKWPVETGILSKVYATSVGARDDRVSIMMFDARFDPVGQLFIYKGKNAGRCSATLVEIDGYKDTSGRPLLATAGHCVNRNAIQAGLTQFVTNYVGGDGKIQTYSAHVIDAKRDYVPNDRAILVLNTPLPAGLKPAKLIPDYKLQAGNNVSALGYPADLAGLQAHFSCEVRQAHPYKINTNCDIVSGQSGGPLTLSLGDKGQLAVVATNSQVVHTSEIAIHDPYTASFLNTVHFLYKSDDEPTRAAPKQPSQPEKECVAVTAKSGLNIRSGPSASFAKVTSVTYNTTLTDLGIKGDWHSVRLPNGVEGWAHGGYLKSAPCQR